jgi:hypothetical membrane protein
MPKPWYAAAGAAGFVLVFLVDDAVKPDYDPIRDFVSEAAIGRGGWVQIANFLIAGALIASFALTRTVTRSTRWLLGLFGVALMLAGVFVADPVPADPVSASTSTWHGTVHNIVSVIGFGALAAACFAAARWRPTRWWRAYCVLTGVAVPVLFVITGAVATTTGVWQRITIVVGWAWVVVLGLRASDRPHRPVQPRVGQSDQR